MKRLHCTLEEAEAEAIRIASEFVAKSRYAKSHRFFHARADDDSLTFEGGKIPVVWIVMFLWHIPGATVDGGEVLVQVNVQGKTARFYDL